MLQLPTQIECGYFDCSKFSGLKQSPKRKVTQFEVEFYLANGLKTVTNGRVYPILKNHIQIAKPGQERYSFLPFKTAFLKFCATGELAERLQHTPDYFCSSHPGRICSMLEEVILLSEQSNSLRFYGKLLLLLEQILADAKITAHRSGANYQSIAAAKAFMNQHLAEPIRLCDIAASVHLSEIYFHRLFTEACGLTPHRYLQNCRLDRAKRLLWETEIDIGKIAAEAGFGCQQYFNKVFKREVGVTPTAYRQSFWQKYTL